MTILLSAVVRELVALGVTGDALVTVLERLEKSSTQQKSTGAIRQARYRERLNREAELSCDIVTSDATDVTNVTQKVPPPLSPSFSPIPPITTPIPPTSKNTINAGDDWRIDVDFCQFKTVYPERAGNADWKSAFKAFKQAVKRETPDFIISKARDYADFCDVTGKTKTEFVRQARTWLNANGWNESYELSTQRPPNSPKPSFIKPQPHEHPAVVAARNLRARLGIPESGEDSRL